MDNSSFQNEKQTIQRAKLSIKIKNPGIETFSAQLENSTEPDTIQSILVLLWIKWLLSAPRHLTFKFWHSYLLNQVDALSIRIDWLPIR